MASLHREAFFVVSDNWGRNPAPTDRPQTPRRLPRRDYDSYSDIDRLLNNIKVMFNFMPVLAAYWGVQALKSDYGLYTHKI